MALLLAQEHPLINPQFTFATGDLTDAKDESKMKAKQDERGEGRSETVLVNPSIHIDLQNPSHFTFYQNGSSTEIYSRGTDSSLPRLLLLLLVLILIMTTIIGLISGGTMIVGTCKTVTIFVQLQTTFSSSTPQLVLDILYEMPLKHHHPLGLICIILTIMDLNYMLKRRAVTQDQLDTLVFGLRDLMLVHI